MGRPELTTSLALRLRIRRKNRLTPFSCSGLAPDKTKTPAHGI